MNIPGYMMWPVRVRFDGLVPSLSWELTIRLHYFSVDTAGVYDNISGMKEHFPTVDIPVVKCAKCGHVWMPRKPNPVTCPACKRYGIHKGKRK